MQCNCAMGLMPEIRRAWLTVDSTIYLWKYEDGKDLAYFDGLNEVILTAALISPKKGVFQSHIGFLLCLTTAVDITILGVSFTALQTDPHGEMHLQPSPLFNLPSDNVSMLSAAGTGEGRIFLAGKDSCLYEVVYQADDGWFSSKCRKVNHSQSSLSFLVPSFLSFSEEDPLIQMVVDSSRHILYTRSSKDTMTVYDLGSDGLSLSRVAQIGFRDICRLTLSALRTGDRSLAESLVGVSVLPRSESSTLHLLAVTSAGLRLYFTTTPNGEEARPSLLALVHVRLPPGFSPSSVAVRPGSTVHHTYHSKGTLVMSASQTEERDTLWMVDSDLFPFQTSCMESHVNLPLEGRTWAISETLDPEDCTPYSHYPRPPVVVTQHAESPRQLVLLTTQGSYLLTKLRPVDQLRHLLETERGAGGEAVEAFFRLHKETQACAMSLVLTTGTNQQVAGWAAKAFFKYGGEPHFVFPTTLGPASQPVGSPAHLLTTPTNMGQTPQTAPPGPLSPPYPAPVASPYGAGVTPYGVQGPVALGRAVVGPEVQFSGKFTGLCRYLSRLLRPIWNYRMTTTFKPPGDYLNEQFQSNFSLESVAVLLEQLYTLRAFLEHNSHLFTPADPTGSSSSPSANLHHRMLNFMRPEGMPTESPSTVQQSLTRKYKADAHLMEQNSLKALHQLLVHCCEFLSLWKLLCEYQLNLTIKDVTNDQKEQLKIASFRHLVVSGKPLTSALISRLLERHAGDSGLSDTLSARLRETTPTLFSHDDATASKAQELLSVAVGLKSQFDQMNMLRDSLKHFSQVTHQINLSSVCSQYHKVAYYEGIVELCLCAALHRDPQGMALHYYKNGQPQDDLVGRAAFLERGEVYAPVTVALEELSSRETATPLSSSVPLNPGPPTERAEPDKPDPRKEFAEMLALVLRSKDELLHVTVYSWLIAAHMAETLVEIQSPFIEDYLNNMASVQQDNRHVLDLLWRYYEKTKAYSGAARILDELAHKQDPELTLDQRVEYMSRGVMCAKSSRLTTTSDTIGELLHELEEKMEVARIQLQISEALKLQPQTQPVKTAIRKLDGQLADISTLYGEYADTFELSECKLAIVHCAGHYDPTLIESLWREIIDGEVKNIPVGVHSPSQLHGLRTKLVELGQQYSRSERYFPLAYLVQLLEQTGARLEWDSGFVHQTLLEVGVALSTLFGIYDRLFKAKTVFQCDSEGQPQPLSGGAANHDL
ncbi:Nuclear pore complex protein Nup155 [Geodia barretti]|uniref:Nuclear pore complex protein Nup155 n=1 Tax=Geodia barretti TaxID=519541 RepID=A0AA35TRJ7_GEOBA|nr:Nuclear pore complex protein Nup155 [Geodia barretti]